MGKKHGITILGIISILLVLVMASGCTTTGNNTNQQSIASGEQLVKTITLTGTETDAPGVLNLPANTKSVRVEYELNLSGIVSASYVVTNSSNPKKIMISDDPAETQSPINSNKNMQERSNTIETGNMTFGAGKYFVYPFIKGTLKVYATT